MERTAANASGAQQFKPVVQSRRTSRHATRHCRHVIAAAEAATTSGSVRNDVDLFEMAASNLKRARRVTGLDPRPSGLPPGPSGDCALDLLSDPLKFLKSMRNTYGDAVGLLLGGEWVALISDPTLARAVLIDKADVFVKEGTAFFPGSSLAGNGLLVSDGDVWRRQRRLSNPAFRTAAVERYSQAMVRQTDTMLSQQWYGGGVRDVYADFNTLTLDITLESLFGSSVSSSRGRDIADAIRTAFQYFTQRAANAFIVPEWVPTWDNVQYNMAVRRLDDVVYDLISTRRRELQLEQKPVEDLLDQLLSARDGDGSAMADDALRDELMTLLIAGQETSAIALAWTCALLAFNPSRQSKAAREVHAVLRGQQPCFGDIARLPYTIAVVLEALRMLPPAYLVGRCACRDVEFSPYHIQKGTTVLVAPYLMHNAAQHWTAPQRFSPDRWLQWLQPPPHTGSNGGTMASSNGSMAANHGNNGGQGISYMSLLSGMGPNGAYVPFGGGPRICIGGGYAMAEAVLVVAMLLQKFELQPPSIDAPFPQPTPLITLRPSSVRLRLAPRAA